ncbi:ABC transporter ATP-binding protein/permease [Clostridium sp. FP2]|uniref:ABC transporter ATP-binding protein n=1 Tax=Clostridium TaxID=1485 RepID=UPI0013E921BE|nr:MULTISPECIES: ABC transporter ATP-binding protein [Clostridium]MBW9157712.1 ABC transporter ATP-binding protein/permease [Clostridium tagluense]MBZ9622544.1 ABC transporter ATP-binding protein/permease [Clostridium sp. FP2]WLC66835.1 ABC transporter ATP-binding protein/permease [Clostridium tagluense]
MKNDRLAGLKKDFEIMRYFLKLSSKMSKSYIPVLCSSAIFKAITPFINIIMPKFIIDELLGQKRVNVFIMLVSIIVVANGILNLISRWIDTLVDIKNMEIINGFDLLIGQKIMDMDFEKIEDPDILNLKERAIFPLRNQGVLERMIKCIVDSISQFVTAIGLLVVISTLNFLIVFLILGIVLLNSFLFKKSQAAQYKFHGELIPLNRKFGYYAKITSDFSMGKDVRLYNIRPLIVEKIEGYNEKSVECFGKLFRLMGKYNGLNEVNMQLQMIVVYAYMTYKVFKNSIGIGDFTMYISAANKFSTSISDFFKSFIEFRQMCRYLDLYLEFEQIESSKNKEGKRIENINECNIEFKNVSFKYPRSENYTLKNVSININNGEKLSVVGLNGAGKTTFIKLLTRLYEPAEGEILLNGVNIGEYNYDDYMKLLSVVFQDYKLLAFSVKENIAFEEYKSVSDNEIMEVLNKSGLEKAIKKLDKGIYTSIYKTFDKDGIEFSGGQSQKLAMARAVYKNAPIVVLDEPTAALDPIAEFEIYTRFNELIGDKTTIYISHRLSSCKFCDKIAVFHKGEIVQYGTHDELIKESGSQYEAMYMAQAQYYV